MSSDGRGSRSSHGLALLRVHVCVKIAKEAAAARADEEAQTGIVQMCGLLLPCMPCVCYGLLLPHAANMPEWPKLTANTKARHGRVLKTVVLLTQADDKCIGCYDCFGGVGNF